MRETVQIWSFFWPVFSSNRTANGDLLCIFPHSVWMRKNKRPAKTPNLDNFHAMVVLIITSTLVLIISDCYIKRSFENKQQNVQEKIQVEMWFQKSCKATLLKSSYGMSVLLQICSVFSEHFFLRTSLKDCFCM